MVFSSLTFLFIFLPIILLIYNISKNIKYKNIVLLLFSLLFYSWGEPKYIVLMLLTTFISYIAGIIIDKNGKNIKSKVTLILSIFLSLLSLFIFKYLNFSINIVNVIFKTNLKLFNLVLPIGISFYTFQILSYVIDLYRGKVKLQKNPFKLLLYVSFFPQLIAGPIVRYETVEKEINERKVTLDDFTSGFKRFILGLSKKVLIANNVAIICDYIYGSLNAHYGSGILWIAALAYTIQIYFDFSGYSDMAIGLGRIFGFHFLENFNYPYISNSITDFWRRWHISLSTFFRDYVYIPLGGNRVRKIINIRNLFIVWILTGLWHGANFNYIIWGLYYLVFLLIEKFIIGDKINKIPNIFRHILTLFIVVIGWVLFRLENFDSLINVLKVMFTFKASNWFELFRSNVKLVTTIPYLILGIIFSLPIDRYFHKKVSESNKCYLTLLEDLVLGILFCFVIVKLVSNQYNPFIYFRF